jgi:hypothetical protein
MKCKRWIRLSYANVVASLALFAALGGSSYAAISITGAQVRDGSLTGRDVRDGSLTGRDVRDKSLLARDFKSGQLPAGPAGAEVRRAFRGPRATRAHQARADPRATRATRGRPGQAPAGRRSPPTARTPRLWPSREASRSLTQTYGAFTIDTGASTAGKAVLASIRPSGAGNGATVQAETNGANGVFAETFNSVGSVVSEDFTVVVM